MSTTLLKGNMPQTKGMKPLGWIKPGVADEHHALAVVDAHRQVPGAGGRTVRPAALPRLERVSGPQPAVMHGLGGLDAVRLAERLDIEPAEGLLVLAGGEPQLRRGPAHRNTKKTDQSTIVMPAQEVSAIASI